MSSVIARRMIHNNSDERGVVEMLSAEGNAQAREIEERSQAAADGELPSLHLMPTILLMVSPIFTRIDTSPSQTWSGDFPQTCQLLHSRGLASSLQQPS